MATPSVVESDLIVRGTLRPTGFSAPADCIGDTNFNGSDPLSTGNQDHLHTKEFAQVGTSASETKVIHYARAAGSVTGFRAGSVVANIGAATVTVDLKKNGTTVLSAVITLDNANAAYTAEAGTISSASYVSGDVFTVVTVATAGGGTLATGVYAAADFDEAAP